MTESLLRFVAIMLGLFGLLVSLGVFHVGCTPPTAAEKREAAAAAYEAEQMACVEQYADTAHIDACRDKVKARWAKDAGHD